jgi:hypothetical protein
MLTADCPEQNLGSPTRILRMNRAIPRGRLAVLLSNAAFFEGSSTFAKLHQGVLLDLKEDSRAEGAGRRHGAAD